MDTTVQRKNIKYPHDAYLMSRAREAIVKLCKESGISLNDTYAKSYKSIMRRLWKYKQASESKKKRKLMKRLKTLLGRLIRIYERGVAKRNLSKSQTLWKIKRIYQQSCLSKKDKKEYKKRGNSILYSFHAPEAECIGKGKLHQPYEFGNKVSIAVSGKNNFVLSAKSFHSNPYDGHTLKQTLEQVKVNTGVDVKKAYVDLGYRGHNVQEKGKIYTPNTRKKLEKEDVKMQKRRSAVEPIIGHLKKFCRMGCNYLKGVIGDVLNPLLSAVGLNLRNVANHLMRKLQNNVP